MQELSEEPIYCPYCGERITILVDCSVEQQAYIEDCQVCCRPISISVAITESGLAQVSARTENE